MHPIRTGIRAMCTVNTFSSVITSLSSDTPDGRVKINNVNLVRMQINDVITYLN